MFTRYVVPNVEEEEVMRNLLGRAMAPSHSLTYKKSVVIGSEIYSNNLIPI